MLTSYVTCLEFRPTRLLCIWKLKALSASTVDSNSTSRNHGRSRMSRSPETTKSGGEEGRGKYWLAFDPKKKRTRRQGRGEGNEGDFKRVSPPSRASPSLSSSALIRSSRTAQERADLVLIINRRLKWEVQKGREGMMYGAESNSESVLRSRALYWGSMLRDPALFGDQREQAREFHTTQ